MSTFAKTEQLDLQQPKCRYCGNQGFLGCPEAILPGEVFIVVAWRRGVPCDCNAGREFAVAQKQWRVLEAPEATQ